MHVHAASDSPKQTERKRSAKTVAPPLASSFVTPAVSLSLSLATTLLSSCSGPAFVSLSLSVCVFVFLFVKSPAFHHEFEQVDVPAEAQLFQEEQEGRQR